ncbi:hypothetical protein KJ693_00320 [bacterium]|nr:hypothetical protein [bacterium]
MREATIFQDWFLEAEQKGMERGMERGMEKGMLKTLQEDIRNILEERFGIVKGGILKVVDKIENDSLLRTLLRQSLRVKNLEEFREILSSVKEE